MFPSIKASSKPSSEILSHNQGQKQAVVVPQPQIESIVYQPSPELKRLKNINKWHFLLVMFSAGVGIINFCRLSNSHIFLGVVAIVAGSISLFVMSPADRTYIGLWRTGGAVLAFGRIVCFWDLYYLLTWQHYLAIAFVVIVVMWIIGAGSH